MDTKTNVPARFVDSEKWRQSYANGLGVEELTRTFNYTEKPEVSKYYPQYYHKIDKVRFVAAPQGHDVRNSHKRRTDDQYTLSNSARST